jgi:hypothetical protein
MNLDAVRLYQGFTGPVCVCNRFEELSFTRLQLFTMK